MNTLPVKTEARMRVEDAHARTRDAIAELVRLEECDGYVDLGEIRQVKLRLALDRLREARALIGECL